MDLIRPTPFAGAENDGLLDTFDPGGSAHAGFYSLVGFGIDLVIPFYEKVLVKLKPDIVAIHHQHEVLIVLRP